MGEEEKSEKGSDPTAEGFAYIGEMMEQNNKALRELNATAKELSKNVEAMAFSLTPVAKKLGEDLGAFAKAFKESSDKMLVELKSTRALLEENLKVERPKGKKPTGTKLSQVASEIKKEKPEDQPEKEPE